MRNNYNREVEKHGKTNNSEIGNERKAVERQIHQYRVDAIVSILY